MTGSPVAPDVLSDRLATLVEFGVMEREPYQEPGARARLAYKLTPAGEELRVVLGALQQWGDLAPAALRRPQYAAPGAGDGPAGAVGFVDDRGREVALADVAMIPADRPARATEDP